MSYIELSNGRIGWVEDLTHPQFIEDLKRLNLTYIIATESNYNRYMILNALSPEQVYHQMSGKYIIEASK
jgi:L-alanine-DL-glutamate epimerase-like enolase superfamily enzyme